MRNNYSKALGHSIRYSDKLADGTRRLTFMNTKLSLDDVCDILDTQGLAYNKVTQTQKVSQYYGGTVTRHYIRVYVS